MLAPPSMPIVYRQDARNRYQSSPKNVSSARVETSTREPAGLGALAHRLGEVGLQRGVPPQVRLSRHGAIADVDRALAALGEDAVDPPERLFVEVSGEHARDADAVAVDAVVDLRPLGRGADREDVPDSDLGQERVDAVAVEELVLRERHVERRGRAQPQRAPTRTPACWATGDQRSQESTELCQITAS